MNTKTEQISSKLPAVAWMDYNISSPESWTLHKVEAQPTENDIAGGFRSDPLVRLSDAETKLAEAVTSYEKEVAGLTHELDEKDIEIERLTECLKKANANAELYEREYFLLNDKNEDQAERIKELESAAPKMLAEMLRYLPVLDRAEADPELWGHLTHGLGIATLNGYRAAIDALKGE